MTKITTFAQARAVLAAYYPDKLSRIAYTLEHMQHLLDFLGNPQDELQIVHVAGTSGKTSTCYYAAGLLQAAGARVGLTVSPHVDEINERVQINGQPLSEKIFCAELEYFLELVQKSHIQPTYFELLVAFAFWEFKRQQMEYAVVEVGLGGLLDATNTISSSDKLCIITDIGMDHTRVLGNSLPKIAEQKAGIIQFGNAVFCYDQAAEIMAPIVARARQKQADLHCLQTSEAKLEGSSLPLFQQRNFALAHAAIAHLLKQRGKQLSPAAITEAQATQIPARMEIFSVGGKQIILDGAHNGQKLTALTESLLARYLDEPMAALVGFVAGSEATIRTREGLAALAPHMNYVIATQFAGAQDAPHVGESATKVASVAKVAGAKAVRSVPDPVEAFQQLLQRPEKILLVTGSFYLLNHIRPLVRKLI